MNKQTLSIAAGLIVLGLFRGAEAQIDMGHFVIGSGATETTSGKLVIAGTFGQPMVGIVGNNSQGHGAGFWWQIASGLATDIEKLDATEIPGSYRLDGNYPNPFNPTTTIRFSIPEQAPVKIAIFDMLGKVVAVLVNTEMGPGEYRVTWNARDAAGNPVSSGAYLYRLETTNYASVKMMTLLK